MHLRIFHLQLLKAFSSTNTTSQLHVNDVITSFCHSLITYVNQLFPSPALQVSDAVK